MLIGMQRKVKQYSLLTVLIPHTVFTITVEMDSGREVDLALKGDEVFSTSDFDSPCLPINTAPNTEGSELTLGMDEHVVIVLRGSHTTNPSSEMNVSLIIKERLKPLPLPASPMAEDVKKRLFFR